MAVLIFKNLKNLKNLKNIVFFVILTLFIAINRFSTFFRNKLNNDSQVVLLNSQKYVLW